MVEFFFRIESYRCPDNQCGADWDQLRVHSWTRGRNSRPILQCRRCGMRFSTTRGTPLFRSRLRPDQVESLRRDLVCCPDVRYLAAYWGLSRNTVRRYRELFSKFKSD